MTVIEKHLFAGRLERVVYPRSRFDEALDIVIHDGGRFLSRLHQKPDLYRFDRTEKEVGNERRS